MGQMEWNPNLRQKKRNDVKFLLKELVCIFLKMDDVSYQIPVVCRFTEEI